MRFGLLGSLQVLSETDQVIAVPAAKQRIILAALLLSADKIVSVDQLADALWGTAGPPNAAATVRTYVMRLRHVLGRPGARITGQPPGYLVDIRSPGEFDVAEVGLLRSAALGAAEAGQWDRVSVLLRSALGMWRGAPLVDVPSDALYRSELPQLAELRLQLIETRVDADLHLGRSGEMVAELQSLVAEHPLREHFAAQLMLACYRNGRQGDSLQVYADVRTGLVRELGIEPGPELREMHCRILDADAGLFALRPALVTARLASAVQESRPLSARAPHVTGRAAELPLGAPEPVVPRQLPAGVRRLTARTAELLALDALADEVARTAQTAVISVIAGTAGAGKTALAVHWARRAAERFPDGQLFVDLRGFDPAGQLVSPAEALRGFLDALHARPDQIPNGADAQAALYRSLVAGKRMLIVLDNARDAEQVRPLVPGSAQCLVIVTSRCQLAGLAGSDARLLNLDVLTTPDAVGLLADRIGEGRVRGEPEATAELARLCAGLPLALVVAAARAAAHPSFPLAALAAELRDARTRLDLLAADEPAMDVRAVLSWSCRELSDAAARMFWLLGLQPGSDISAPAAANLAGIALARARQLLAELTAANLLTEHCPGRFGFHDLLRAYARELAACDGEDERRAALTGLFDYYLGTAAAAMDVLFPAERHRRPRILPPAIVSPLAGAAVAMAWLETELANLVTFAAYAARRGWPGHATRLSATLPRYLAGAGHLSEATAIHMHALGAAHTIGDRAAEASALSNLSQLDLHRGHGQQAASRLGQALTLFHEIGDLAGEARALHNLATVEAQEGRYRQAGEHHQRALRLYLAAGNQTGAARALHGLSNIDLLVGRYQLADDHLKRALDLCRETGDQVNEAYVLANLGDLNLRLGRHSRATSHLAQALSLFREAGDRTGEAFALTHLGASELGRGRGQLAIDYHLQAGAVARESQDRIGEAEALNGLGEAYLSASQPRKAHAAHVHALNLTTQTGDRFELARAYTGLARAHHADGDVSQALDLWHNALTLYDDLGTPEADQVRVQLAACDQSA